MVSHHSNGYVTKTEAVIRKRIIAVTDLIPLLLQGVRQIIGFWTREEIEVKINRPS